MIVIADPSVNDYFADPSVIWPVSLHLDTRILSVLYPEFRIGLLNPFACRNVRERHAIAARKKKGTFLYFFVFFVV